MTTKFIKGVLLLALCVACAPGTGYSQEGDDTEELKREIRVLKDQIRELKSRLDAVEKTAPRVSGATGAEKVHEHGATGVKGLADRVRRLEEDMKERGLGKWADRVSLSGQVEVEALYEDLDHQDRGARDTESSDIRLATVELGVDAGISKYVGAHLLFLWEEDETEPVDLDEGYVILDGKDVLPFYLNAGKMYVPFGRFESHFVSDPLTLELGETRETAVKVGTAWGPLEACLAVFNGDVEERGRDDHVRAYVLGANVTAESPPGWSLRAGGAYLTNLADTDSLGSDYVSSDYDGDGNPDVRDEVGGLSLFLSLSFHKRFFWEAEYVGALDRFEGGELAYDGGRRSRPRTWNLEMTYAPRWDLEVGVKAEGSRDCGRSLADGFLPERQYGVVVNWEFFEKAVFSVEYLRGLFHNDDTRNLVTTQVAVEF